MSMHIAAIAAAMALGHRHIGVALPRPPSGPHTCPKCGKQFNGSKALKQHTKDVHK